MLGELLALSSALLWSLSVIIFKRIDNLSPTGMNLFKNCVAILLFLLTMAAFAIPFELNRSLSDWIILAISGFLGIAVADTLFFAALARMGAGALAIVECAYSPIVVAASVVLLSETLSLPFAVGACMVIAGVLMISRREGDDAPPVERRRFLQGVGFGVASVGLMGLGIVLAKPVIERSNLFEVTAVRLIFGNLTLLPWVLRSRRERQAAADLFRPQAHWKHLVPAAALGSYVAMVCWVGGMKYTSASVAAVLNQLSSVFTLALSWLILKEPLTRQRLIGGASALTGAITILTMG